MASRLPWSVIRRSTEYRGRWVALGECIYDAKTSQPVEGAIVDVDRDLVTLCTRLRTQESSHCAILFCDGDSEPPPSRRGRA